jgi:hypothetical protein
MNEAASRRYLNIATPSRKSSFKQVTLDLTPDEADQLEKYCSKTGKAATDVIRELIQNFPLT